MSAGCCGNKEEALASLRLRQNRTLVVVLVINASMFVAMLAGALWSGSSALLSNSLDNLGDALTYALSLWAVGLGARAKAWVALFKGVLILGSALAIAAMIGYRLLNPAVPLFAAMGGLALANMIANGFCLWLLMRHRADDINMSSVYECSRNDVAEGAAVLLAAGAVWLFDSGWPDLALAACLLLLFLGSALRIVRASILELRILSGLR